MIQSQVDLTALNTLRLPSTARYFARFTSLNQLHELLAHAQQQKLAVKVLGSGSNVLLNGDIDALVLNSAMTDITAIAEDEHSRLVAVEAGVLWHSWVEQSLEFGHGLENLALIPGTVGAAPVQNIGAYGVEVGDFIEAVEGVRISTLQRLSFSRTDCQFAYRDSLFKHELAGDFVITRVIFRLQKNFKPVLNYGPLAQLNSNSLTGADLIQAVCAIRQSKLPDPAHIPNAGSFFKNPLISKEQAQHLQALFPHMPSFVQVDGQVKLAAAWLIEQCGFKGKWLGNVRMHSEQALVLTTNGQASFADLMALKEAIVAAVQARFDVELEAEPQVF